MLNAKWFGRIFLVLEFVLRRGLLKVKALELIEKIKFCK
jgi:hypothetical protein